MFEYIPFLTELGEILINFARDLAHFGSLGSSALTITFLRLKYTKVIKQKLQ